MNDPLTFYHTHSPMTDPGEYAYLYDDLPDDLEKLFEIINGVLLHAYDARDLYGPTSIQRREQFLRTMHQRLARIIQLDPAPLTVPREIKQQQIGYCRDFAVFMTSILRHKGYAARTRSGFGAYFDYSPQPPYRGDHWITEFWNPAAARWQLIDAELGGENLDHMVARLGYPLRKGIDFTNLRANEDFYLAPYSWLAVRQGEIDVKLYRHNARWRGWPMLRGNLLHDFQALNNLEMGLFDYWDDLHAKPESAMTAKEKSLLDRVAQVCLDPDQTFEEMRSLFEEMARTRAIRSRLKLIGILGDGMQGRSAPDLLESDFIRLVELTEPGDGTGSNAKPNTAAAQEGASPSVPASTVAAQADPFVSAQDRPFDGITILGARQNNLKGIDVRIPRNKLVVLTGVSGSGKSSLAFDTIYAEGHRRYMESLSSFARQFMRQMEKPLVDKVIGLNPAVAIEQHTISPNSRATVGSITEVIDYLRLLFARTGRMHCPACGRAVEEQSAYQIARRLVKLPAGTRCQVWAPLDRFKRYSPAEVLERAQAEGFDCLRIHGEMVPLQTSDSLEKLEVIKGGSNPTLEAQIADLTVPGPDLPDQHRSFQEQIQVLVERGLEAGQGILILAIDGEELRLGVGRVCPFCNLTLPRLEPRLLNPNTIFGMCLECNGLGIKLQVDPERIITKPHRSLLDDASPFRLISNLRRSTSSYWVNFIRGLATYYGADLEKPWNELPEALRRTLIYGSEGKKIQFEFGAESEGGSFQISRNRELDGAIHHINRLYRQTKSEMSRRYYRQFMRELPCPQCHGERLNMAARFVTLANQRFPEITDKAIGELLIWVRGLKYQFDERQHAIGGEILKELEARLQFICDVGLHYLTLDRPGPTLSGGEAQRIRLAGQIGSELTGVLYVLDEPSIGLHPRDQNALLDLLCHLRDAGNTVLVVEHDADTMRRADTLIDIGPGAGAAGGEVVAAGTPAEVMAVPASLTGRYLSGDLRVRPGNGAGQRTPTGWLALKGACLHNLKSLDVHFPLGVLTCITGVSGSGKSSLITQTLSPALAQVLQDGRDVPGPYAALEGTEQLRRVVHITQAPIGRNPRSNPGTYVGVLAQVRKLFAATEMARERGYPQGHFSFNSKGGRCEACQGYGANPVKMHFMADVWVRCPECEGLRFTPQVLEVRYQEANIADVLEMDVSQACEFFGDDPKIRPMLGTLMDVGLGYLKLGQSATTLSGGEAQRVKLAKELSRNGRGDTLYILDEPTTGLHFADIQRLLEILSRLTAAGNSVMVIEHNLDVIRTADWVIDLGPEGGEEGGYLVAQGPPAQVAGVAESYTGQFLRRMMQAEGLDKSI